MAQIPYKKISYPPKESLKAEVALNRPDFFVIDTLSYYVNPLDFKAMKKFFEFLVEIRNLGTAVIVVAHTPKSEIGKRLTEASCYGSVAQLGDTEQLLSVNKIKEQVFLNVHFTRLKPFMSNNYDVLFLKESKDSFYYEFDKF